MRRHERGTGRVLLGVVSVVLLVLGAASVGGRRAFFGS